MGSSNVKDEQYKYLFEEVKNNTTNVNILLVGESHAGKSCFANGCFRIMSGKKFLWPLSTGTKERNTTFTVNLLNKALKENFAIKLFDAPGINIDSDKGLDILKIIIDGVEVGTSIDKLYKNLNDYNRDEANKIDVVYVVESAKNLIWVDNGQSFFSAFNLNPTGKDYLANCVQIIKEKLNVLPSLIITGKDQAKNIEKIQDYYSLFFPKSEIFFITNYTEETRLGDSILDTDIAIANLLITAVLRCQVSRK